jgi:hypothetical protein
MLKDREGVIPLIGILVIGIVIFMVMVAFFFKYLILGVLILIAVFVAYGLSTGQLKIAGKHGIIALILVVVLIFVAVGGSFLFELTPILIDTDTKNYTHESWTGLGNPQFGDEIFNKDAYAVSFKPGAESETITFQALLNRPPGTPGRIMVFEKYELYWSDDGVNWGTPIGTYEYAIPDNNLVTLPAVHYAFFGEKPNSAIRVEVYGVLFGTGGEWQLFAEDQAYIYQGAGDIEIKNPGKLIEIGERVIIEAETLGFSGGRGWTVQLFSYAQNRVVQSWNLSDESDGAILDDYIVSESDWQSWSDCGGDKPLNRLEARLYNNLFKQDEADADVTDIRSKSPPEPTVSLDQDYYNVNDVITVSITGARNNETNVPICQFVIDIYYQPGPITVEDDVTVIAQADSATFKSNPLSQPGTVRIEVVAYDDGGRPSEHSITEVAVKPIGEACNPLVEVCGDKTNSFGLAWIWIILIIVFGVLIGYLLLKKKRRR